MTDNLQKEKASLRKTALERRKEISKEQKALWDKTICEHFFESFDLTDVKRALCYNSLPLEVDTSKIAKRLLEKGVKLYFPKTDENGNMEFYEVCEDTRFVEGFKGVREPDGKTEKFSGDDGLCIVPGLCFEKNGKRLGYGAGFYDRFLSCKKLKKIALAYDCFTETEVPCSQNDVRMDYIITERGVITCAESREA